METQYSNSATHSVKAASDKSAQISTEGKVSKSALMVFLSGATLVFAIAIYYCSTTNHVSQAGILAGALAIIYVFAANVYKSFK